MLKEKEKLKEYVENGRPITVEEQLVTQKENEERKKRINENCLWKKQMPEYIRYHEDSMRFASAWKKEGVSNYDIIMRLEIMYEEYLEKIIREEEINEQLKRESKNKNSLFNPYTDYDDDFKSYIYNSNDSEVQSYREALSID